MITKIPPALLYMILAVGLTVLGSIGNAAGYVLQKKGHLHHRDAMLKDENNNKSLLRDKFWLSGFVICLIGSILTAIAFKFGAQSVLAPLSALVLVFNAIFANRILKEAFTRNHLIGISLVIIGSTMAVIYGPKSNTIATHIDYIESCWRNPSFLTIYGALSLVFLLDFCALKMVEKANQKSIELDGELIYGANFAMLSYTALAAYFGSVNVLFMKSLMIIISTFELFYFEHYILYVTAIGIILVNVLLEYFRQRAIKFFDASYVVPIFQVLLILGAACMGAIFFGEFASLTNLEVLLFIIAIVITVLGVAVLAFHIGSTYKQWIKKVDEKLQMIFSLSMDSLQSEETPKPTIASLRVQTDTKDIELSHTKSKAVSMHRQTQLQVHSVPVFLGAAAAMGGYYREATVSRRSRLQVRKNAQGMPMTPMSPGPFSPIPPPDAEDDATKTDTGKSDQNHDHDHVPIDILEMVEDEEEEPNLQLQQQYVD